MIKVGKMYSFQYRGRMRTVKVETVRALREGVQLFTAFDPEADYPTGGYRSFRTDRIQSIIREVYKRGALRYIVDFIRGR